MKKMLVFAGILTFLLAACSTIDAGQATPTLVMEDQSNDMDDDMDDIDSDMDEMEDGIEEMKNEMEADDEMVDDEMKPEVRTEMMASDPDSFTLASGEYQLVEFIAYWCSTCKALAPVVHQLEVDYHGAINFVYLDIDDPANDAFKAELGYLSQPHIFLLDPDGNIVQQWIGYVDQSTLEEAFEIVQ